MQLTMRQLKLLGGKLIEPEIETTVFLIERDFKGRISQITAGGYRFEIFRTQAGQIQSVVGNRMTNDNKRLS